MLVARGNVVIKTGKVLTFSLAGGIKQVNYQLEILAIKETSIVIWEGGWRSTTTIVYGGAGEPILDS